MGRETCINDDRTTMFKDRLVTAVWRPGTTTSSAQSEPLQKKTPGGLSCVLEATREGGHKHLPPVSHRGVNVCTVRKVAVTLFIFF